MFTHFSKIFPLAFPTPIDFKPDALGRWLPAARSLVKRAVRYYSQDFSEISVDHPSHDALVAQVDMAYLPCSELEIAFADYYVTTDSCTEEKP